MICLVSDFDGTLYDDNFLNNLKSVRKFMNDNNIFVIATGRTFQNIKTKTQELNIPYDYLICSDGAAIYDKGDNLIYNKYLDKKIKEDIIQDLKNDKRVKTIMLDDNNDLISNIEVDTSRILVKTYNDFDYADIINQLRQTYSLLKIYKSPNWINISYETKDVAISYLEKIITPSKLYVVGDSDNDIEMIEKYDGYIMKKNSSYVNNNYKVIDSIENLIHIIKN